MRSATGAKLQKQHGREHSPVGEEGERRIGNHALSQVLLVPLQAECPQHALALCVERISLFPAPTSFLGHHLPQLPIFLTQHTISEAVINHISPHNDHQKFKCSCDSTAGKSIIQFMGHRTNLGTMTSHSSVIFLLILMPGIFHQCYVKVKWKTQICEDNKKHRYQYGH